MLENLEAPYNDIPDTPTSEDIVLFAFQIYWINLKKLDEEYAKVILSIENVPMSICLNWDIFNESIQLFQFQPFALDSDIYPGSKGISASCCTHKKRSITSWVYLTHGMIGFKDSMMRSIINGFHHNFS